MLDRTTFIVSEKRKLVSSRNSYEIRDEAGKALGTAEQSTALLAKLIGMVKGPPSTKIEFRASGSEAPAFTVRRHGLLMKKVDVVDAAGKVLGVYKAKRFSLSGGFHVYDAAGKHLAEIKGKMLKSEYTFVSPDGKTELGKVSKKWGGAMKELFSSADTYGVQIAPAAAADERTKVLILGAAVAMDCLMGKKAGGGKGKAGDGDDE